MTSDTSPLVSHPAPATPTLQDALRYGAYPALLAGLLAAIVGSILTAQDLALAGTIILFAALAGLVSVERLIPFESGWQPDAKEWARDGLYFGLNGAVDAATKAAVAAAAVLVAPRVDGIASALPLIFAAPVAILVADLAGYWMHRKSHDIPWLWRVHGVHHAPTKVNTFNNNTAHFLNIALSTGAKILPLLLLGFAPEAVFAASLFLTVQSFAVHANADLRLGALNWIFMGPEHHRLHHSVRLEEAGNHATGLTLWDWVFGTLTWRPGRRPASVGTVDPNEFPPPNRMIANALVPFRGAKPTEIGG